MTHFLERAERSLNFTDDALRAFQRYRWPGNVRELLNVVEQLLWLSTTGTVGVEHLPVSMRSGPSVMVPLDDRRRQVADDLYDALVKQGASFWEHVYPMFLARDITRHDLRAARSSRPAGIARPLQVAAQVVRHVEPRLPALHELPGGARLQRRVPRIPWQPAPDLRARRCRYDSVARDSSGIHRGIGSQRSVGRPRIPSRRIFDCSVVRLRPRRAAAPDGPAMTPPDSLNAPKNRFSFGVVERRQASSPARPAAAFG